VSVRRLSHNRLMSRIEWSRYNGDDIESVVSMFVCRDKTNAFRIRPSRGDGGIDVCVPTSTGHVEIYQVKKFAENLNDSQKGQIVKSHKRIQDYARDREWVVDRWHLTMPLDPTPENDEWLEELQNTATFPCEWKGLAIIEGWAAKYGDVVDYYLGNWGNRLIEEIAKFSQLSGIRMTGTAEQNAENFANLSPAKVEEKLGALRGTLNSHDPHFTYDFAVTGSPIANPVDYSHELLPAAVTSQQFGDSYVTFWVYERCAESLRERPITFTASIITVSGSPEHQDMEYFVKYGRVPTGPVRVEQINSDLPGGLGGSFEQGHLQILDPPDEQGETFDRMMKLLSADGDELARVVVTFGPPVSNHDRTGMSNKGRDSTGLFEIETLTEVLEGKLNLKMLVHRADPTGHYPDEIEPVLEFLQYFKPPNVLRISAVRGATAPLDQTIPETDADRDPDAVAWNNTLLRYVRALSRIQKEVRVEVKLPDLTNEPKQDVLQVLRAARLLDGETIERNWETIPFVPPSVEVLPEPEAAFYVAFDQDLTVTVAGQKLDLGTMLVVAEAAKLGGYHTDEDGTVRAELIPAVEGSVASFKWRGNASAADKQDSTDDERD
jgi:hypothetical protein